MSRKIAPVSLFSYVHHCPSSYLLIYSVFLKPVLSHYACLGLLSRYNSIHSPELNSCQQQTLSAVDLKLILNMFQYFHEML